MARHRWLCFIASAALLGAAPSAHAQDMNACVAASEKGLSLRKAGKLVEARKELATCAADACPDAVKTECRKRIGDINGAIPGVVFDVKDASGTSLTQVKVSIDGAPLVDHLDGTAIPVNPGQHKFGFEAPGQPLVEKTYLILEGEKAHRETVALASGAAAVTVTATAGGGGPAKGALGESCGATSDCEGDLKCIVGRCTKLGGKPSSTGSTGGGDGTAKPAGTPGESSYGGIYIQAALGGVGFMYFPDLTPIGFFGTYDWAGFRPDIEFGFHPSGRHDGFVIGLRQAFTLTGLSAHATGTSQVRLGYDVPLTVADHELNIGPFAAVGIGYIFNGPGAGIVANGGVDAKLFLAGGFYAFVRPVEIGVQCYFDAGICGLDLVFGAGVGVAIGK